MDLLASYDDDNTGENSETSSPKASDDTIKTNLAPTKLENEWLSFEQMIAPGGPVGNSEPVKSCEFLVNGVVAYPGMKSVGNVANMGIALEEQYSASSDNETGQPHMQNTIENNGANEEEDDAFFRLRKQVKEQDRSSSSDRSGSSRSSSPSSRSPSPPHLSPVNSIKSHTSEPPDLTEVAEDKHLAEDTTKDKTSSSESKAKERHGSRSKDRKRSHRDSSSKHDHGSSKSKRRRSRSHSKDRKRRSRDRHRRKEKKSRDRKSRKDSRRSKSRDRKDSKSELRKSESRDHKDSKSETLESEIPDKGERRKSESGENKDSKCDSHRKRSRSRDRKDRKKGRRSRSHSRHRHRSKDRKSKERKRSKSRDRKRKQRSRSRERRSRSRHRDRYSRSRSRERLRSRSPVLGRKLTFKEQMRKEFINASKEMSQENKAVSDLTRKPGEALRPSDLLKGVKLTGGDSVTPQMALMQTMAAMHKKAQELTGVEVPKYYNPAAVNPLKYAEQVQKRKLLWSKKTEEKDKNEQIETQWKSAFISGDEDGKAVSKFRKLMGMKGQDGQSSAEEMPEDMQKMSDETRRKQTELFQRLDQEYQFARMTTHTQRGVGLGFSTTVIDPNHPQNPT